MPRLSKLELAFGCTASSLSFGPFASYRNRPICRRLCRCRSLFPGTRPGAMMGKAVMTRALRQAGTAASGHRFRSSFRD